MLRKAQADKLNLDSFDRIVATLPNLGQESKQTILAKILGRDIIPLPILENRTYSATDVGVKLGLSPNMVGRIANQHDLKTTDNGIWVLDKSNSSDKQVQTFRYNDKGLALLTEIAERAMSLT